MLLMGGDRKRMVTQILGEEKKEGVPEGPLHAVANELIDAIHAHDVEGVIACLKSAFAHIGAGSSGEG